MIEVPFVQDSPEWHALRLAHVGASEVAALFQCQPDYALDAWSLWQVKAGRAPYPALNSPRARWGLKLEEVIAEACAEEQGWEIRKGGYAKDPTCPRLGASLDSVILSDPDEDGPGLLECKNVDWLQHRRKWENGEPPLHILLQLQHQIAASGYMWGAIGALVGGNQPLVYRGARRKRRRSCFATASRKRWAVTYVPRRRDLASP